MCRWAFGSSNWEIGPINIETARLEAHFLDFVGFPLALLFQRTLHRGKSKPTRRNSNNARLTPAAISDQSLELTWDIGKDS